MSIYDESPGNRNREAFVGFLFFIAMVVLLGALLSSCCQKSHEYDASPTTMTVYGKGVNYSTNELMLYCSWGNARVYMAVPDSTFNTTQVGATIDCVLLTEIQKKDEHD